MAKSRKQVKRVKRGTMARTTRPAPTNSAGCDHVRVVPEPDGPVMGYRIYGVGFATFAWDVERMADTPRFVCSTCEASTALPGLFVKRGDHG